MRTKSYQEQSRNKKEVVSGATSQRERSSYKKKVLSGARPERSKCEPSWRGNDIGTKNRYNIFRRQYTETMFGNINCKTLASFYINIPSLTLHSFQEGTVKALLFAFEVIRTEVDICVMYIIVVLRNSRSLSKCCRLVCC
jgi:hypothetical protein